jgi:hypothetical protein
MLPPVLIFFSRDLEYLLNIVASHSCTEDIAEPGIYGVTRYAKEVKDYTLTLILKLAEKETEDEAHDVAKTNKMCIKNEHFYKQQQHLKRC